MIGKKEFSDKKLARGAENGEKEPSYTIAVKPLHDLTEDQIRRVDQLMKASISAQQYQHRKRKT